MNRPTIRYLLYSLDNVEMYHFYSLFFLSKHKEKKNKSLDFLACRLTSDMRKEYYAYPNGSTTSQGIIVTCQTKTRDFLYKFDKAVSLFFFFV